MTRSCKYLINSGEASYLLIFFFILLLAPLFASGQEETAFLAQDKEASQARMEASWALAMEALNSGQAEKAKEPLRALLEAKWNAGIVNDPARAAALMSKITGLKEKMDSGTFNDLMEDVRLLAPRNVGLRLGRAHYYLSRADFSPAAAYREYMAAVKAYQMDIIALNRCLHSASATLQLLLGFIFTLFAMIMVIRYAASFLHDFSDIFPRGFLPSWMITMLGAAVALVPIFFSAPIWALLAYWILIFGMYMSLRERITAVFLFLFLLPVSWLSGVYASTLAFGKNETLQAILNVRLGQETAKDLETLEAAKSKDPENLDVLISIAIVHYKEGRFRTSSSLLAEALKQNRDLAVIYNNLGCLYMATADLEQAKHNFELANQNDPDEIFPVYNLSQVYNASLDINKYKELFSKARDMDAVMADDLSDMKDPRQVNRAVAVMPLPLSMVLHRLWAPSGLTSEVQDTWWRLTVGLVSEATFPYLMVILAAITGISFIIQRKFGLSRPCSLCGAPVCPRCQRMIKDPGICPPCFHAFREHMGIDPKVAMEWRAKVHRRQDIYRTAGMIVTVLAPGSGHILLGAPLRGVLGLMISGLFIFRWLTRHITWAPAYFTIGSTSEALVLTATAMVFYMLLAGLFIWDLLSHSEKWR